MPCVFDAIAHSQLAQLHTPCCSPARHLWREAGTGGCIALLAVPAVLLVLRRVARAAPTAAPREAAPPRVSVGLLHAMLLVLRVVLLVLLVLVLLVLRHRQVKHVIRQRCGRVLQGCC